MFSILLVEDNLETLEAMPLLLKRAFRHTADDLQIDTAPDVAQAAQKIDQALQPYDVVILDGRLPAQPGFNAEADVSLCLKAQQKMRQVLVIHYTAYPDDETISDHIREYHTERAGITGIYLAKEAGYENKLIISLKRFLYGKSIEARLNRLFGGDEQGATSFAPSDVARDPATHELAELCYEIKERWDDLDELLQNRIGQFFELETESRPIKIRLW